MKESRAESIKIATSLLAVANTPLFVPTELKQRSSIRQFALSTSAFILEKQLRRRLKKLPKTLSEEASAYLFATALSLKGEVGVLMSMKGQSAEGYRWFAPIIDYLCASTYHQTVSKFVSQPLANFTSNIAIKNGVPTGYKVLKDNQI